MTPSRPRLPQAAGLILASAAVSLGAVSCSTSAPSPAGQVQATAPAPSSVSAGPAPLAPQPTPAPGDIPVRDAAPTPEITRPAPVRVQIEEIGLDLEVVPTGVRDDGEMVLPDNHRQAGWYRYGPPPGSPAGSAVLAAHLDTGTEALPIARLDEVRPGTVVTVTRSDGSTVRYAAGSVEQIAKRDLNGGELFDRSGEPLLKLVTCGGEYVEADDDYADNIVLTAAPLP
ncbi:Sortase family protein [Arthrobacter saudimassiliensis]|uniref:Sortase family protein n=1 Tax=Arthrobacter saudimassiliensis TaxID=1461584 RepID=A0A078MQ12_9MICC|nr:Sortase family protein [Arthrobacter saudimassiliensis]